MKGNKKVKELTFSVHCLSPHRRREALVPLVVCHNMEWRRMPDSSEPRGATTFLATRLSTRHRGCCCRWVTGQSMEGAPMEAKAIDARGNRHLYLHITQTPPVIWSCLRVWFYYFIACVKQRGHKHEYKVHSEGLRRCFQLLRLIRPLLRLKLGGAGCWGLCEVTINTMY